MGNDPAQIISKGQESSFQLSSDDKNSARTEMMLRCFLLIFFPQFSCALPRLDGIPVTQEDHRQDTKLLLLQIPQHPEI